MNYQPGKDAFGFGPMHQACQSYFAQSAASSTDVGYAFRGMARWQLEVWGLMSRRGQAYMELPTRLGQCRTPQEVQKEQIRFAQKASQQYLEASARMFQAWQNMMMMPLELTKSVHKPAAAQSEKKARDRDFIYVNGAAGKRDVAKRRDRDCNRDDERSARAV